MPPAERDALAVAPPMVLRQPSAVTASIDAVVTAIRSQTTPGQLSEFAIALSVAGAHFAVDAEGRPALLVPTAPGRPLLGRDVGGLSLSFGGALHFRVSGRTWESSAVVLTCLEDDLLPTFCSLALDVVQRVASGPERPSPREVSDAIAAWERLLRSRRRLTAEEETGLWGELWILSRMQRLDAAVEAWQGPSRSPVDFLFGQTALECKTSGKRLTHDVSQSQLGRPAGDARVFFVSLWIGPDPMGASLPDLVRRLDERITDPSTFEAKLLDSGYSRADASLYRQRLSVREEPLVFPEEAVPRVRSFDPGVSAIRFTAVLDELAAIEHSAAEGVVRGP